MPKKIVISGYYGFGNTGDEAVLAGILATFRILRLDADVTVLSADPERTKREHPGVQAVHRFRLADVKGSLRQADLFISGGGSLLQDVTSARSTLYYLFILKLAQHYRVPTVIYAQGVGPLNRLIIRKSAAHILNRTRAITVRDADSKDLLESMGVKIPVDVTADPAFLVEPDLDEAADLLDHMGLLDKKLIGISLRPWKSNRWLKSALDGISSACSEIGAVPVVIPMQEETDADWAKGLESAVVIRGVRDARVIKGIIAECGILVGMRLHSLIFAADVGVPVVPISYDPKVTAFAAAVEQKVGMDVENPNSGDLKTAIIRAWQDHDALSIKLGEHAQSLRKKALESCIPIKQLLGLTKEH
jgi:polysaccharide pyruvyl transferase CsaB